MSLKRINRLGVFWIGLCVVLLTACATEEEVHEQRDLGQAWPDGSVTRPAIHQDKRLIEEKSRTLGLHPFSIDKTEYYCTDDDENDEDWPLPEWLRVHCPSDPYRPAQVITEESTDEGLFLAVFQTLCVDRSAYIQRPARNLSVHWKSPQTPDLNQGVVRSNMSGIIGVFARGRPPFDFQFSAKGYDFKKSGVAVGEGSSVDDLVGQNTPGPSPDSPYQLNIPMEECEKRKVR